MEWCVLLSALFAPLIVIYIGGTFVFWDWKWISSADEDARMTICAIQLVWLFVAFMIWLGSVT